MEIVLDYGLSAQPILLCCRVFVLLRNRAIRFVCACVCHISDMSVPTAADFVFRYSNYYI